MESHVSGRSEKRWINFYYHHICQALSKHNLSNLSIFDGILKRGIGIGVNSGVGDGMVRIVILSIECLMWGLLVESDRSSLGFLPRLLADLVLGMSPASELVTGVRFREDWLLNKCRLGFQEGKQLLPVLPLAFLSWSSDTSMPILGFYTCILL